MNNVPDKPAKPTDKTKYLKIAGSTYDQPKLRQEVVTKLNALDAVTFRAFIDEVIVNSVVDIIMASSEWQKKLDDATESLPL